MQIGILVWISDLDSPYDTLTGILAAIYEDGYGVDFGGDEVWFPSDVVFPV